MESDLQPTYGPERKVNSTPRRLADISKAKRLLNFETRVPLEQGLRQLVAWWQEERSQVLTYA
jgi:UDP-glucose 4-epimerase